MEISPETTSWKSIYKIMIGSVVPRPIGWISTMSADGLTNLAPFSFFNVVCPDPPTILFCPNIRSSDLSCKDTLRNVRETGEFVANIVTEELSAAMNITSTELPAGVDEFTAAHLTPAPSQVVKPPRVSESPIHYECRVAQIIDIGEGPGGGSVVIGQVVHLHVRDELLIDGDKVDLLKLRPVGRLAGNAYCRVTDIFELVRPPSQIKPVSG